MRTVFLTIALSFFCLFSFAQDNTFDAYIYNKEYDVFIRMNLYKESIKIPGQEVLGEVYGYLQKRTDGRAWLIMDVNIDSSGKVAVLEIINDYGSEDLTAELRINADGTYQLKQLTGSVIKVAGKGKWIKLPKVLQFAKP